jgi:hypothetical protein
MQSKEGGEEEEGELLFSPLRRGSGHTAPNVRWFLRQTRKRVPETAVKNLRCSLGDPYPWIQVNNLRFVPTAQLTEACA